MSRSTARDVINSVLAAVLVAILYRYWLTVPALLYFSMAAWLCVGVLVFVVYGCAFSFFRLPIQALACSSLVGLLVGGTWGELETPNDVSVLVGEAFRIHLITCWPDIVILTVAAVVTGFCFAYMKHLRPLK
jgi:hypothetical protein